MGTIQMEMKAKTRRPSEQVYSYVKSVFQMCSTKVHQI